MASPSTIELAFQPAPGPLLQAYNFSLPASSSLQAPTIPQTLKDSFSVRANVFVAELCSVPLQHHIDADDARSCHWVLYANSDIKRIPVATVRLVPPPHHPHPKPGARYERPDADVPAPDPKVLFGSPFPECVVDRKTDLHDGVEPYIKLGRLCVLKEYRGNKLADLVIQAALVWAKQQGNKALARAESEYGRKWSGLVCVHAQKGAIKTWGRNGFVVDEAMGEWFEAGIPHVAMFLRLDV